MKGVPQQAASASLLVSQESAAVIHQKDKGLEDAVQKLRGFETLGIRETNEGHEALQDGIEFTGERFNVSLQWEEVHPNLPSNYRTCFRRLKGQLVS